MKYAVVQVRRQYQSPSDAYRKDGAKTMILEAVFIFHEEFETKDEAEEYRKNSGHSEWLKIIQVW